MANEQDIPAVADAVPAPALVTISVMAGDTHRVDYQEATTVREYLQNTNVRVGDGQVVTANGGPVDLDQTLAPNTVVVVAGKVANG
jgi:hypothetical protein